MPTLPRTISLKPVKLQGRLEETFYKKSDDGLQYRHKGDADLWLVETKDGQRATLAVPRRGQGWMYDRNTTWLTNSPREGNPMAKTKRRPPKGYKTWSAYMASIRPNPNRKKTVRRKNRPKAKAKKRGARRSVIVVANPPKRRGSMRRRRNPDLGAYVRQAVDMVLGGAIGGGIIVATEAGTRLIRKRALGMPAGTLLSGATELGISTTAGILANHFLPGDMGKRVGQLVVDAGFASVIRAAVKQSSAPWVSDALSDDGPQKMYVVRGGKVVRRGMGGYVPGPVAAAARLNGYVPGPRAAAPALGGYVAGNGSAEMAAAANYASR